MLNAIKYLPSVYTILDPRFKDKFFSRSDLVEELQSSLKDKVADYKQAKAKIHLQMNLKNLLASVQKLHCYSAFLKYLKKQDHQSMTLSEPLIEFHRGKHCLNWWTTNKPRLPFLAELA